MKGRSMAFASQQWHPESNNPAYFEEKWIGAILDKAMKLNRDPEPINLDYLLEGLSFDPEESLAQAKEIDRMIALELETARKSKKGGSMDGPSESPAQRGEISALIASSLQIAGQIAGIREERGHEDRAGSTLLSLLKVLP